MSFASINYQLVLEVVIKNTDINFYVLGTPKGPQEIIIVTVYSKLIWGHYC